MFSSSLLQIELDRIPAIYYGSELLTGIVHLTTNESHLHTRQLSVELYGKATYEIVYDRGGDEHRDVKTFTFLFEKVVLNQSSSNQEQCLVPNGRRSWPFEIELPISTPPTFEVPHIFHKNHPAIEYTVVACLRRTVLNNTETQKIFFCPPILLKPEAVAILSAVNRQAVHVNIELPQGLSYVAGEIIEGTVEIDNPKNIQIKRIECRIEQTLRVYTDGVKNEIVNVILPIITNKPEKHLEGTFRIQIPEDIPPTYNYDDVGRRTFPIANVSYSIIFEVCVVGLLADFSVTKPLTIAIDPWKHENDGTIVLIDRTQSTELPSIEN